MSAAASRRVSPPVSGGPWGAQTRPGIRTRLRGRRARGLAEKSGEHRAPCERRGTPARDRAFHARLRAAGQPADAASFRVGYLAMLAAGLLYRVNYRTRLWICFIGGYVGITAANLINVTGAYARAGLIVCPMAAMVLWSSTAARVLIVLSGVIVVAAPFVRAIPALPSLWGLTPRRRPHRRPFGSGRLGSLLFWPHS
jgi:hypothetical protein